MPRQGYGNFGNAGYFWPERQCEADHLRHPAETRGAGLFEEAEERLGLSRKGAGIAFTVPVIGMQHPVFQVLSEETGMPEQKPAEGMEQKREEGKQHMTHVVIWVSVESGYSDEVADAARSAGANGGTVVHGLHVIRRV